MAHSYLGESFDIHGGGLDLIFPHHENEIAQSEAAGYKFANVWMHNAWVTQSGEKMSKSLGNTMQVKELIKQVRGIELRFYLGSAHYRSMLEFSPEALQEAATNFQRIENFLVRAKEIVGDFEGVISASVKSAFDDDLAVPQVLAQISEALRRGNTAITETEKDSIKAAASEIRGALAILGCDPFDAAFNSGGKDLSEALDGVIQLALTQRAAARERKDFASSDAIRDGLAAPQVLAQISEALRRGNTAIKENATENLDAIKAAASEIRGALAVLGCDPFDAAFNSGGKDLSDALDGVIQLALAQRAAARERKDFAASDAIRDGLTALGISIEDTPQGQRWTIKG